MQQWFSRLGSDKGQTRKDSHPRETGDPAMPQAAVRGGERPKDRLT